MSEPAAGGPPARLDRRYWRLWGAVASSNLGDGLVALALPWLASLLTRDPLAISGVALATRLPWLVFSLQAGTLTDRYDRRRLMVVANSLRALVALAMAIAVWQGVAGLAVLYLAAFALGMCEVVFDNTSQAILPGLVPRERLERANGTILGAQLVIAEFVARPLAGALVGIALSLPFAIDAVTAALSAALIASIPGSFRTRPQGERPEVRMRAQITEGMRWLWHHRLLRTLALTLGVMNGVSAAILATFVLFAQEVLGLDGLGFGLLLASFSIGGLLGSLLAPGLTARIGPGPSLLAALVVPIGSFAAVAASSNVLVTGAAMAVFTFMSLLWNVVTVSLRQTLVPDELLGRVNSVYRFFGWGAMPIGTLLGGGLVALVATMTTRELGLRSPFVAGALIHVLLVAVVARSLTTTAIRAAQPPQDTDGPP